MPTTGAETRELTDELKKRRVRFLLLQFTDLLGVNKAVEVPASQFEKALAGEVLFDGSALEGFARVEEADALLVPDLASFRVFPWESGAGGAGDGEAGGEGAGARLSCDSRCPDGRPTSWPPCGSWCGPSRCGTGSSLRSCPSRSTVVTGRACIRTSRCSPRGRTLSSTPRGRSSCRRWAGGTSGGCCGTPAATAR